MTWTFQDAKARLSEVARRARSEGPQRVTVRGRAALVVLSEEDFTRLSRRRRLRPLAELYRASPVAGIPFDVRRSRDTGRKVSL
ncbi:MAG: type II toxin-antitoxin system prevent-host-death family antitoxin [Archangium sp.]|nr:type II toxin-antitoxin system prevent-host-death family antitoxin [Archangium sp.]